MKVQKIIGFTRIYYRLKHLQYRQKISFLILIFTLVPFITLGSFTLIRMWKSKVAEIVTSEEGKFKTSVANINNILLTNLQKVNYINENSDLQIILSTNIDDDLASVFTSYNNVRSVLKAYKGVDNYSCLIRIYTSKGNIYNGEFSREFNELDLKTLTELMKQKGDKVLCKYMDYTNSKYSQSPAETGKFICIYKPIESGFNDYLAIAELMIPFRNILDNFQFDLPKNAFVVYLGNENSDKIILNSNNLDSKDIIKYTNNFLASKSLTKYYVKSEPLSLNSDKILIFIPKPYIFNELKLFIITASFIFVLLIVGIFATSKLTSVKITLRLNKLLIQTNTDIDKLIATASYPILEGNDEFSSIHSKFFELVKKIEEYYQKLSHYEVEKKSLELMLLHERINPHLLYNTLASIVWAFPDKRLAQVVNTMVNYYRIALNKGNEILKVSQEIEMVKEYLDLQKFAYKSDFTYIINVDKEVLNFSITKHLLQPFVENAILHGIMGRENGGLITISGELESDKMIFKITDNGVGIDQDKLDKMFNNDYQGIYGGYGIKNIQKRLELYYGTDFQLIINSKINQGTTITIVIPTTLDEGGKESTH